MHVHLNAARMHAEGACVLGGQQTGGGTGTGTRRDQTCRIRGVGLTSNAEGSMACAVCERNNKLNISEYVAPHTLEKGFMTVPKWLMLPASRVVQGLGDVPLFGTSWRICRQYELC